MNDQILDADFREQRNHRLEYVGFWPRVGASFIDLLVILPIVMLMLWNLISLKSLPVDFFLAFLMLGYKPFFEYRYGGTLGKQALKIAVVNGNYERMDLSTSLIRNGVYIASSLMGMYNSIILFNLPGFQNVNSLASYGMLEEGADPVGQLLSLITIIMVLFVAFTRRKQGLHDLVANTYCVYGEDIGH